jgi:hypothetical protein
LSELAAKHAQALERDRRPMQFTDGPPPPAPGAIREEGTDLKWWRGPRGD